MLVHASVNAHKIVTERDHLVQTKILFLVSNCSPLKRIEWNFNILVPKISVIENTAGNTFSIGTCKLYRLITAFCAKWSLFPNPVTFSVPLLMT